MRISRFCVLSLGVVMFGVASAEMGTVNAVSCDGDVITEAVITPSGKELSSQSIELISDTHLIPGMTIHPMPVEIVEMEQYLLLDDPKKDEEEEDGVLVTKKKKGGDAMGILGAVAGVGLLGGLAGGAGGSGGGSGPDGIGGGGGFGDGGDFGEGSGNVEVVPEPATIAALGIGALALMRKKRKK